MTGDPAGIFYYGKRHFTNGIEDDQIATAVPESERH